MAVVQSAGRIEALGAPWSPAWSGGRSVSLYGTTAPTQDYAALYSSQPNVRTVVDFLARNIAQLNLKTYRRVSDSQREEIGAHPLARTLRQPNPWRSRYWFFHALVTDLGVFDEFYAVKARGEAGRLILARIPPQSVTPLGGSWLRPERFRVNGGKQTIEIPAESVFYLHGHNPVDPRVGLSPLETLRRVLAEEAAAGEYREYFWKNAARIEGVIERPVDAPDWSESARGRFRSEWQDRYAGATGSGLTPVLEEGMTFRPTSFSAHDAQYLEARKLTREEVAAAYHVPPPMVGILDHATFSNIEEQHRMLYQDTLGPWLAMIEEDVELQLLPEFGDVADAYVEFNLSEKLKGSFAEQASAFQTAVGAPWLTRNEARSRQNLPPVDGGDALVVPLNVLVGGQASPTDSAPDEVAVRARSARGVKAAPGRLKVHYEAHRRYLERFFSRQREAILSALARKGRKASWDDVFDEQRWNAELEADLFSLAFAAALDIGAEVAERYGVTGWDGEMMIPFLRENARIIGEDINRGTLERLAEESADRPVAVAAVFAAELLVGRVEGIAQSRTTLAANFGQTEAARASGVRYKRWVVTSGNPRPSHAAMAGQTVPVDETFSNGAKWPGDPSLPVVERARCTCLVEFANEKADLYDPPDPMEIVTRTLSVLTAALSRPPEPPVVNVSTAPVTVTTPPVNVTTPPVTVEAPKVDVHPPAVTVPAPVVNVEAPKARRREIRRDDDGNICEIVERDDG